MTTEDKLKTITEAADAAKAIDIATVDIRGKSVMADFLVVCTGTSNVHVRSVAEKINDALQAKRLRTGTAEGIDNATWVLLDYGDVIAHVMQAEQRAFYRVEELWEQMPLIENMWDREA